jgi:hypothetical protein
MTSRSTLTFTAALLLLASVTGAATLAPNGALETASPAADALMTPAAPAEASAPCSPLLAKLGISPLDSAKDASDYPDCGVCSDLACRGLEMYSFCGGTLTKPKRCKASGYTCLEDPRIKCLCVDWATP